MIVVLFTHLHTVYTQLAVHTSFRNIAANNSK